MNYPPPEHLHQARWYSSIPQERTGAQNAPIQTWNQPLPRPIYSGEWMDGQPARSYQRRVMLERERYGDYSGELFFCICLVLVYFCHYEQLHGFWYLDFGLLMLGSPPQRTSKHGHQSTETSLLASSKRLARTTD